MVKPKRFPTECSYPTMPGPLPYLKKKEKKRGGGGMKRGKQCKKCMIQQVTLRSGGKALD